MNKIYMHNHFFINPLKNEEVTKKNFRTNNDNNGQHKNNISSPSENRDIISKSSHSTDCADEVSSKFVGLFRGVHAWKRKEELDLFLRKNGYLPHPAQTFDLQA